MIPLILCSIYFTYSLLIHSVATAYSATVGNKIINFSHYLAVGAGVLQSTYCTFVELIPRLPKWFNTLVGIYACIHIVSGSWAKSYIKHVLDNLNLDVLIFHFLWLCHRERGQCLADEWRGDRSSSNCHLIHYVYL